MQEASHLVVVAGGRHIGDHHSVAFALERVFQNASEFAVPERRELALPGLTPRGNHGVLVSEWVGLTCSALMQLARASSDRLMLAPSTNLIPRFCVVLALSEPARSIMLSLPRITLHPRD